MLRIHPVGSAMGAKKYYQVSDYYSQGQETIGRPGGKLAARLGYLEKADRRSFERLCDNLHPITGEQLTLRTNDNRRVGYDFVFSGPKSYSVIEALAHRDEQRRLRAAFDEAVYETMELDIEPDMRTRVRKDGAFENRRTGNMVYAAFDHSTSRPVAGHPPDMHRHKHVLVFNATHDPVEDCLKAGEFSDIKRDGEYYTAIFYARLASKLEAMGYAIDRRGGKEWDIAGVPQSLIQTFSKRTGEVEEEHASRLEDDPDYREEYKHELGAKTRAKKREELTPEELRAAWEAQISPEQRIALHVVLAKQFQPSAQVDAREAVQFAADHLFEKESLVPERMLVATALLHGLGQFTAEDVRRELDRQGILTGQIDGRLMATTREVRHEEEYMMESARWGRSTVRPAGVHPALSRGILDDEQWDMVTGLLSSSDRVTMVDSVAGTGKSTAILTYDRGMKLSGETVTYLGTTSTAVKVLRESGLEAVTVARFLVDERMQKAAVGGRVVIDEASMLGHGDAYKLFKLAEKLDLSLVFLGDQRQHSSVPRGALMRILKQYGGIEPFRLTGIKRQEEAGYLAAVKALSEARPVEGFDLLASKGWVREIVDDTDRCRHIAADYLQALADRKTALVVSPTHREAAKITQEIRAQMKAVGLLDQTDHFFTRLVPLEATAAERAQSSTYRPGETYVLIFHQNAKGIKKGSRLTVEDPSQVPLAHADKFSVYRPERIELAEGDVIRFTGSVKSQDGKHVLRNGDVHKVAGFGGDAIRLENGWTIDADAGLFRHGLVETSYGSQGRTVQRVILGMSSESLPAISMEAMYVSASRAKEKLTFYSDDTEAVREKIRQSSAKGAALDLLPPASEPRRDRLGEHRALRRRQAAMRHRRATTDPFTSSSQRDFGSRPESARSWVSYTESRDSRSPREEDTRGR